MNPCDNLPAEFLERQKLLLSPEEYQQLLTALSTTRPTTLRANTLKVSAEEVARQLAESGIEAVPVAWLPNAFIIPTTPLRTITDHPLYTSGSIYVQSVSSMLPPYILDPQPNEQILDLTAAPGSKTTQIAACMKNTGYILANDISTVRLFKLQANLKLQGITNTHVHRGPGELLWKRYPEYFDRALVDVPCSMEGRIQCDDPKSYDDWSVKKIKELSIKQCHLLRSAVTATKVGGTIVYSTCTLAPEENEHVVQWLLEKEGGAVVVDEITIGVPRAKSITQWGKEQFSPELSKTIRILPSETMEGFFVAKLRKIRTTIPDPSAQKSHARRFNRRTYRR